MDAGIYSSGTPQQREGVLLALSTSASLIAEIAKNRTEASFTLSSSTTF
jgi:hypothetical protein